MHDVRTLRMLSMIVLGATTPVHGDVAPVASGIEWQHERLAVNVHDVAYRDLFAIIASKTGVEVQGLDKADGSASLHFEGQPLHEALAAVLANFNYVLIEAPMGGVARPIVVAILGPRPELPAASGAEHTRDEPLNDVSASSTSREPYQQVQGWVEQGDVQALLQGASSNDRMTWTLSIQNLARVDADQARRVATRAAKSDDAMKRVAALQVLGGLDSREAAIVLGAALTDSVPAVRRAAMVGLMGQTSPIAADFLQQARGAVEKQEEGTDPNM